jgi:Tfp pilus assembly protein PilP
MGGERGRPRCNVSLHVAGPVSGRFAYLLNPDGCVQHVEVGEYLGSSEARVSKIT